MRSRLPVGRPLRSSSHFRSRSPSPLRAATLATLTGTLALACGDPAPARSARATLAPPGADDADDARALPCPVTALPTEDRCVIAEAYGVFVAPQAPAVDLAVDAGGDPVGAPAIEREGTRGRPFASLATAIRVAGENGKRVYVCAGTYSEVLTIRNNVSMFGYFDCATWAPTTTRARLVPAPSAPSGSAGVTGVTGVTTVAGVAAIAATVTAPTRIEGFEIVAPDFDGASMNVARSSIGLVAVDAPGLRIVASSIHAGRAESGADGVGSTMAMDASTARGGPNASEALCAESAGAARAICGALHRGGAGGEATCRYGALTPAADIARLRGGPGGKGGAAGSLAVSAGAADAGGLEDERRRAAEDGAPRAASIATAAGAAGAAGATTFAQAGARGADGVDGATGDARGAIDGSGFTPSDGARGGHGSGGQGGGGGLGDAYAGARPPAGFIGFGYSGSGGGAGGCGGAAGSPGRGGGASIAIVALDSPLALERTTLETSAPGRGGAGTLGGVGTPGGEGGVTTARSGVVLGLTSAYAGAPGGAGGDAGASGHGGNGPSVGIAYRGARPSRLASPIVLGIAPAARDAIVGNGHSVAASFAGIRVEELAY